MTVANPSKRFPWVIEMLEPAVGKWFVLEAFKTMDLANAHLRIANKNAIKARFAVRNLYQHALKDKK
jgi:hypothetical protein